MYSRIPVFGYSISMPREVYRKAASVVLMREAPACAPGGCEAVFQVLLLHKPRTHDAWQLPQGGMEEGEGIEEAALRELKEEAGIGNVHVLGRSARIYQYNFPLSYRRFRPDHVRGQRVECIFARVSGGAIVRVDGKEVDQYVWVYPTQLHVYIRRRQYLRFVQKLVEEGERLLAYLW